MCKCYHPSSCGYKISIYNDVVMALLTTWLITSVPVREGGGHLRINLNLLCIYYKLVIARSFFTFAIFEFVVGLLSSS